MGHSMKYVSIIIVLFTLVSCASTEMKDKSPDERKADLYYNHGTQALLSKDYTTALNHLQKAVALTPKDTKVQNNLGMAYYFKGEINTAIKHLLEAIDLDEKNSDARVNLAGIYYAQGRMDLALTQYEIVTKDLIYPFQFRTYYNMAIINERQGKISQARDLLAKSINENKGYCPAYFLLGKMNEKAMDLNSALASYQDATKGQCYEEPAPHFSQAKILIQLGRYSEAQEKLELVMEKFSRTSYFAMASQELAKLKKLTSLGQDDYIQKARIEMDKIRDRDNQNKINEEQTLQGTSF